jgi:hypothetical protein
MKKDDDAQQPASTEKNLAPKETIANSKEETADNKQATDREEENENYTDVLESGLGIDE